MAATKGPPLGPLDDAAVARAVHAFRQLTIAAGFAMLLFLGGGIWTLATFAHNGSVQAASVTTWGGGCTVSGLPPGATLPSGVLPASCSTSGNKAEDVAGPVALVVIGFLAFLCLAVAERMLALKYSGMGAITYLRGRRRPDGLMTGGMVPPPPPPPPVI